MRETLRSLKAGRGVGFLLDQDALTMGVWVRFLGQWASTFGTAGSLAARYGLPVLPVFSWPNPDGTTTVRFEAPFEVPVAGDAAKDAWVATQLMTARIEAQIRKDPRWWFWMHRRFKTRPGEGGIPFRLRFPPGVGRIDLNLSCLTGPNGPPFFDPSFPEVPMPKHVLAKLEKELKDIKQALLVDIPQEIARAAGQGDLSENAEYEQALAKRDVFQNKLVTLEKRISEVPAWTSAACPSPGPPTAPKSPSWTWTPMRSSPTRWCFRRNWMAIPSISASAPPSAWRWWARRRATRCASRSPRESGVSRSWN
ncbi:MAG: hypothetical protein IPO28_15285 [Holophagaceae bacterium]|nr:hypothetical protein [Holophagaceae bacterium]